MKLTKEEQNKLNQQLFDAIEHNDLAAVKEAVAAGADINAQNYENNTPLIKSVGDLINIKIMQFLLEHGANPNLKNLYGNIALDYCLFFGRIAKTKLLLDYKANMYIENNNKRTAFAEALYYNVLHMAELFVLNGYIPTEEDFKDVDTSKKENTLEYFQKLSRLSNEKKQARIEQILLDGKFFSAIECNDLEGIRVTVAAGANVNVKGEYGNTALHKISCNINIAEAKLLLGYNTDMYIKNKDGRTPFAEALKWDSYTLYIAELYVLNGYVPTEEDFEVIIDNDKQTEVKARFMELARQMQNHNAKLMEAADIDQEGPICDDGLMEF